jgi:hypothetical protein
MGNRPLYWILTGPLFAVSSMVLFVNVFCMNDPAAHNRVGIGLLYHAGFSETARMCPGKPGICGKLNIPCHRLTYFRGTCSYVCPI